MSARQPVDDDDELLRPPMMAMLRRMEREIEGGASVRAVVDIDDDDDNDDDGDDDDAPAAAIATKKKTKTKTKTKKRRTNWSVSPHREILVKAINDWLSSASASHSESGDGAGRRNLGEYADSLGIPRGTLFKYVRGDPSKRRTLTGGDDDDDENDDNDGGGEGGGGGRPGRGKRRLIDRDGITRFVSRLRTLADTDGGFTRGEAIDMLVEEHGLTRAAASRQLTRHILPEIEGGGRKRTSTLTSTSMTTEEGDDAGGGRDDDDDDDDDDKENDEDDEDDKGTGGRDGRGGDAPDAIARRRPRPRQLRERPRRRPRQQRHEQGSDAPPPLPRRSIVICDVSCAVGRALLGRYVNDGHNVAGCVRDDAELDGLRRLHPTAKLHIVDLRDDDAVAEWAAELEGDDGTTDFYDVIVFVAAGGTDATTGRDDVPAWEVPREDFVVAYERDVGGLSNVVRHLVPRMMMRRRRTDGATTVTTGAATAGEHDGGVCGGGTLVVVSSVPTDTRRRDVARYASACAIEGLVRSVASSMPDPHRAALLPPPDGAAFARAGPTGGTTSTKDRAVGDGGRWAEAACPMILRLSRRDNGTSMIVPGF